jgi:hypothetical protein
VDLLPAAVVRHERPSVEAGRAPSGRLLGGFIRQEQVTLPDFLDNRFGRAYGQSGQVQSIG